MRASVRCFEPQCTAHGPFKGSGKGGCIAAACSYLCDDQPNFTSRRGVPDLCRVPCARAAGCVVSLSVSHGGARAARAQPNRGTERPKKETKVQRAKLGHVLSLERCVFRGHVRGPDPESRAES